MAIVKELIRTDDTGNISFGDYTLDTKTKIDEYPYQGDLYKIKTFKEITKLKKNGMLVYESVPGTAVENLRVTDKGMKFSVYGTGSAQITLGLEENAEYYIYVDGVASSTMKTKMGGKMPISVDLNPDHAVEIKIRKK